MTGARETGLPLLLVAGGGALGASARFLVGRLVQGAAATPFPWATLVVNLSGCLLFGMVFARLPANPGTAMRLHAFVLTGILGGFTTFSAFSHETVQLLRSGHSQAAALYIGASVAGCLCATALGALIASR